MRLPNALEILRYFVKRFFPTDALPTVGSATNGMLQPVFAEVNILKRNSLRTDVAAAEWIVFVAVEGESIVFDGDFDATDRFAQIATAVMASFSNWIGQSNGLQTKSTRGHIITLCPETEDHC